MLIVGLSGSIATGKSTVSRQLKEQCVPVIDCDVIAHDVTRRVRVCSSGRADLIGWQVAKRFSECRELGGTVVCCVRLVMPYLAQQVHCRQAWYVVCADVPYILTVTQRHAFVG